MNTVKKGVIRSSKIRKALLLCCFVAFLFLLFATTKHHKKNICKDVLIEIEGQGGNQFLSEKDILNEIGNKADANISGKAIYQIDLQRIEHIINKIPFVKRTNVFMDNAGTLTVKILEKQPLVRVVNNENTSYYMDSEAHKFEVSPNFTARVPVVSGYIADNKKDNGEITSAVGKSIFNLASFIQNEPLWKAMVEQVYVEQNGDFIVIPKIGDFEIEIGSAENLHEKFKKLKTFYDKGQANEYRYESINLKYEKQIVCSLKQPAS